MPSVTLQPVERLNLALSAGAAAASWWLVSPVFALSLGVGALLEAANFRGLHQQAQLLFGGEIRSGASWTGLYALRFLLVVTGIGGALALGAHPLGLVIGLSLVMPTALWVAWRNRASIDPHAPALAPDDPEWDLWNPWLAKQQEQSDEDDA
jgi:hypothetical protein